LGSFGDRRSAGQALPIVTMAMAAQPAAATHAFFLLTRISSCGKILVEQRN
jgi:hypothetical protein